MTALLRRLPIAGCPFAGAGLWIVGTVGRMQSVKDPQNLVRAFVRALAIDPALRARLRLVMVGDGALYTEVKAMLARAGVQDLAWLPGERDDVADVLRGLDAFVLPSLAEGVSNTILEAMACGLPVIATAVGGNAELVVAGRTGELVPSAELLRRLRPVSGLAKLMELLELDGDSPGQAAAALEFALEGLYLTRRLSKDVSGEGSTYHT